MPPPKKKQRDSSRTTKKSDNSKREARGMRNEYAKILRHADTDGEISAEMRDARISENITAADGVFSKFSRESDGSSSVMAMDASVVRHISRDVKDRVGAININDKPFKYFEFATKIAGLMGTERSDETRTFRTNPKGWARLAIGGAELAHKFHRVPSYPPHLHGEMDAKKKPKPRTPKPKRTAMAKRIPATRISKKKTAEVDEDQAVENMVASLHKDFLREFRNNDEEPVNFYEFVCDPSSFANTVENIFHVSFLVNRRKVALVDNEESSLPELIPITSTGESGSVASKDIGTDQRIVSLDMKQWRAFVRIFGIEKAMVERK